MSRAQKTKTYTDASRQLLAEGIAVTAAGNHIEVALEKRKKEAGRPLYLKRI